jgi:hypothetical protein
MTKIKFTNGEIVKLSFDYYNITLMNGENIVYKATIERLQAAELIDKYYPEKINYIR